MDPLRRRLGIDRAHGLDGIGVQVPLEPMEKGNLPRPLQDFSSSLLARVFLFHLVYMFERRSHLLILRSMEY
jgi:hypothetical protein